MERTLHRQLKERYALAGGRVEAWVEGLRIDAVEPDGTLVEVQTGSLGPLRGKLVRLLDAGHSVRVVKPIVTLKRIVKLASARGKVVSVRMSPKRGALLDVFEDLVGVARVWSREGLQLDLVEVAIDERRVARRRWPGFSVIDREVREVIACHRVQNARGLWDLVPGATEMPNEFTTRDIAVSCDRSLWFAQRVAYCLHHAGVAPLVGKRGNSRVYARVLGKDRARVG